MDHIWSYHRAYPYSHRALGRKQVRLYPTPANVRDNYRRPVTSSPRSWPECSEPMVELPDPGRAPPSLVATVSGTFRDPASLSSSWRERAHTPLWQPRSARPRLLTTGFVVQGGQQGDVPPWMARVDTPLRQSAAQRAWM